MIMHIHILMSIRLLSPSPISLAFGLSLLSYATVSVYARTCIQVCA